MVLKSDWASLGNCRDGDPDALFVDPTEQHIAKRICRGCLVRYECLADALDNRIEFGVWGGMTERERRAILRRHPQVSSWWLTFERSLEAEQSTREAVRKEALQNKAASPLGSTVLQNAPPPTQNTVVAEEAPIVQDGASVDFVASGQMPYYMQVSSDEIL